MPKDFIASSSTLFPGLPVQLVTIVHKERIYVKLKTLGFMFLLGKVRPLHITSDKSVTFQIPPVPSVSGSM